MKVLIEGDMLSEGIEVEEVADFFLSEGDVPVKEVLSPILFRYFLLAM